MNSPWWNLLRRWRLRASRWHPGEPHHEVVCSYEEWYAAQPRKWRREHHA